MTVFALDGYNKIEQRSQAQTLAFDKSTFYTKILTIAKEEEIEARPEYGCYACGLYLEGATWDLKNACLLVQEPKVLVTEMPLMQIIPVEANRLKLFNTLRTPVYVTQNRRNAMGVGLVFEADLTTKEHASHWVLQGVGLCLNIDS